MRALYGYFNPSLENIDGLFSGVSAKFFDLSALDVSGVKSIRSAFHGAKLVGNSPYFIPPLGVTSNVTNTSNMFNSSNIPAYDDLKWIDTTNVTDMTYMFYGYGKLEMTIQCLT